MLKQVGYIFYSYGTKNIFKDKYYNLTSDENSSIATAQINKIRDTKNTISKLNL